MRVNLASLSANDGKSLAIDRVTQPFAIIVSQDCDLEQDFNSSLAGKTAPGGMLPNILLCEVRAADGIKIGPPRQDSKNWKRIQNNKEERYQFLQKVTA